MDPSHQAVKHAIARMIAAHPELADDELFRLDVLEGETDTLEYLSHLIKRDREESKTQHILRVLQKEYKEREEDSSRRQDGVRAAIADIMNSAGLKTARRPEGTISVVAGKRRVALEEDFSPPQGMQRIRVEPDKSKIRELLEAGEVIPGASLVDGEPSIQIR